MTDFFIMCMDWVAGFIGSYGWAIVLFTVVFRLLLSPLDYKTRRDMRKQQAKLAELKPKLDKLEKKYKNNPEKLKQKQQELYQKENYNPFSGCSGCLIPMILQFGLLFIFLAAFRAISEREMFGMIEQLSNGGQITTDSWLWVDNIWLAESANGTIPNMNSMYATINTIFTNTPAWAADVVETFKATLEPGVNAANEFAIAYNGLYTNAVGAMGTALPVTGANGIGFPILPILVGGSSIASILLNPQQQQMPAAEGQSNPKTMGIVMAVLYVFICWSSSAAFSLYFLISNIVAMGNNLVINKILDIKDAKKKAAEQASSTEKEQ